jgi:PKD repeat protein
VAKFSASPIAPSAGGTVTFTDISTDSDGKIAARWWDLDGDGVYGDSTAPTASRTFATAGTYRIGLKVVDNAGATATTTMSLAIAP